MRGMQRVFYAVLLQYCCSVDSNIQCIVYAPLCYVWLGYGMLFMLQQYGMYKQHISLYLKSTCTF